MPYTYTLILCIAGSSGLCTPHPAIPNLTFGQCQEARRNLVMPRSVKWSGCQLERPATIAPTVPASVKGS